MRTAGSPGAWGCTGGAGGGAGSRLDHRRHFRIAEVLAPPRPWAAFPPHTPPFPTPSYLLAKKATQGKRRSWVSTKTFWTNRLGLQLCCRFKDRVSQNQGNRTRLCAGVRAGGKTMPSDPPHQSRGVLKESYGFRILRDQALVTRRGEFLELC